MPGYVPSGPTEQELPFWNADTRKLERRQVPLIQVGSLSALPKFKTLAIVGGEDHNLSPALVNVDALLVVQPSHWQAASELRIATGDPSGAFYDYEFKDIEYARVRVDYSVPDDAAEWAKAELARDPALKGKAAGLATLIKQRRNHEMLAVYGMEFPGTERILCSAISAIKTLGRSAIVPVLNELPKERWSKLHACLASNGVQTRRVSISDPTLGKKMRAMKEDSILIVNVGSLPQPVFYYLMDESTLPPLAEGNSTIDFLSMRGKPFFSTTGRKRSEIDQVSKFQHHAYTSLVTGDAQDLAWAMRESLKPDSELSKMFKANQEAFFSKPDKLGYLSGRIEEKLGCNDLLQGPLSRFRLAMSRFVSNHLWSR
ncbi:MAG: hypothetical protein EBX52_02725 [Proteobacteria bacterium]|nr:hypothetical protein [Pseudomonadota bacterium]